MHQVSHLTDYISKGSTNNTFTYLIITFMHLHVELIISSLNFKGCNMKIIYATIAQYKRCIVHPKPNRDHNR